MALPLLRLDEDAAHEWRTVLDSAMSSQFMCEQLNAHWQYARNRALEVIDCQLARIYPRKNGDILFEFELRLCGREGERDQVIFAEWAGRDVTKRCHETIVSLSKRRRGQLPRDETDLISCIPGLGLLIRLPGLDERIDGLRLICEPALIAQILRTLKLQTDHVLTSRIDVELLSHRLGKRCVVRVSGRKNENSLTSNTDNTFILKLYKMRTDRGRFVYGCMKRLWMNGFDVKSSIRIPKLIVYLGEWNALFMEDVDAVSLSMLSGDYLVNGLQRAGQALNKLHSAPIHLDHQHTVDDEIELLRERVNFVSLLVPELGDAVTKTLLDVTNRLNQCRQFESTPVHRDFYEKQILIDGDQTILLDFDTLCMSDPALDVGNFIAHLTLNSLQGNFNVAGADDIFNDAYDPSQSSEFRERVAAYTQSSLLRLACLYAIWPRWRHVCEPLLEFASDK